MKQPFVSIIVPIYNIESYLRRCLNSIIRQTYENYEVILVDDGSSDGSGEICDMYVEQDIRFRVVHQENQGVSVARNKGLDSIKGDYFMFIDGDDWIAVDYVSRHINLARESGSDIVCTGLTRVTDTGVALFMFNKNESPEVDFRIFDSKAAAEEQLYLGAITNSPVAKLFSSRKAGHLRFDVDLAVGEDMEYVFRAILSSDYVAVGDINLYAYVQRSGSAMNSDFNSKNCDAYRATKKMVGNPKAVNLSKSALQVKVFTEAFWLLLKLPQGGKGYERIYLDCSRDVHLNSRSVWRDGRVDKKRRLYALTARINVKLSVFLVKALL